MIKRCEFKAPEAEYYYAHAPHSKYKVKYILTERGTLENEFPDTFRLGFTACEGYCEFIEFTVKTPD